MGGQSDSEKPKSFSVIENKNKNIRGYNGDRKVKEIKTEKINLSRNGEVIGNLRSCKKCLQNIRK